MPKTQEPTQIAMNVSVVSIAVNLVLSVGKLITGILGRSTAMVSDAIHSASDIFSTLIVIVGVKISAKEEDSGHPYGHEKFECIAAILLAFVLCATGIGIGYSGIRKIVLYRTVSLSVPTLAPLIAAVVSIAVKEWMFWYTRAASLKTGSGALMADAWHHRSDALSSIGSLLGIGGAMLGFPILDPIAAVVICLLIVKAAYDIIADAVNALVDSSCDPETYAAIEEAVTDVPGVVRIDLLKTRRASSRFYVDVDIAADSKLSLLEAHKIAQAVHDRIEGTFPGAKHCMVHVNPCSVDETALSQEKNSTGEE